jgi:hypothetical protein
MDSSLAEMAKLISTFGLAFFSFWAAIPAGLALGLSPLAVIATTTASYAAGVGLVALAGERVRTALLRRLLKDGREVGLRDGRLGRIWARYGLAGLALLAPMTLGAQLGAAVGVALNAPPRRLWAAMTLGALGWSVALTALVALGVVAVRGG